MAKICYRVLEHFPELFYTAETEAPADSCWAAEDAAANFYEEHGGFGTPWPLTVALHAWPDGPELCRYEVCLESTPVFVAAKKVTERQ